MRLPRVLTTQSKKKTCCTCVPQCLCDLYASGKLGLQELRGVVKDGVTTKIKLTDGNCIPIRHPKCECECEGKEIPEQCIINGPFIGSSKANSQDLSVVDVAQEFGDNVQGTVLDWTSIGTFDLPDKDTHFSITVDLGNFRSFTRDCRLLGWGDFRYKLPNFPMRTITNARATVIDSNVDGDPNYTRFVQFHSIPFGRYDTNTDEALNQTSLASPGQVEVEVRYRATMQSSLPNPVCRIAVGGRVHFTYKAFPPEIVTGRLV